MDLCGDDTIVEFQAAGVEIANDQCFAGTQIVD